MQILVTGGAGFIGSHVCENLCRLGYKIFVIDNLSTGNYKNLNAIKGKITFFQSSVEDFDFESLPYLHAVIHLAAQVSVPLSISNFYHSSKTNILSSLKVIDFCIRKKIPYVYASSSAVYGSFDFGDDGVPDVDLLSPYATDKFMLETYSKLSKRLSGSSNIGLRFYNVYGPRQDSSNPYSGVISIFIDRLIADKAITIYGGSQTRDFVYVEDLAKVITKSLDRVLNEDICDVFNVLTGKSVSIDFLADALIKLIPCKGHKVYRSQSASDPIKSAGSTSKLIDLLGEDLTEFKPLEEGLTLTLGKYRKK